MILVRALDECTFRLRRTSRRDHGKQSKMNLTLLDILFVILSEYCILRRHDRGDWIAMEADGGRRSILTGDRRAHFLLGIEIVVFVN